MSFRPSLVVLALLGTACGGGSGSSIDYMTALLQQRGEQLFDTGTFGGNGRTCASCHSESSAGTITPEALQALYQQNPNDPMFAAIDSDDGQGHDFTRLLGDATVRVTVPLPPFIRLKNDPAAATITYNRGIPTVFDTPALDPVLMSDGRAPTLQFQAKDAIHSHMQSNTPTVDQLNAIAAYEKTLFSSPALKSYFEGGPLPQLPPGNTDSEKRGRTFFDPDQACGFCHGGPFLNTEQPSPATGDPGGERFASVGVSELNPGGQPMFDYVVMNPDGSTFEAAAGDLGQVLIDNDSDHAFQFKIPTLWNIKNTAPYFHDNSAKTLEDVVEHYANFFRDFQQFAFLKTDLSTQDKADIVAYLKLL